MGGEKSPRRFLSRAAQGSPPRGRGKAGHGVEGGQHLGITPAWAGKRSSLDGKMFKIWDHPRVGGEKSISGWKRSMPVGSPPRGRGKEKLDSPFPKSDRITPAWAGKSATSVKARATKRDHPRVGGEKLYEQMEQGAGRGSPPRGRGKASFSGNSRLGVGITPAWAGKSLSRYLAAAAGRDHPRVGGEKGNR